LPVADQHARADRAGQAAAEELARQFRALLGREQVDASVANTIGYLSQAYEATAGLIGNTLVALGREPGAAPRPARMPASCGPSCASRSSRSSGPEHAALPRRRRCRGGPGHEGG